MNDNPSRPRVLIVDDVPVNIKMLEAVLSSDYKISSATNGPDALEMAASHPRPNLILMDIMMPGMDGYEVCKKLKAGEETRNIPVVFITAKGQQDDEAKGLELGAVDYVSKPFNTAILKARVRNHVELKTTHDELMEANRRLATAYAQMRDWKDQLGTELHGEEIGVLVDADGHIKGATERAQEATGLTRLELVENNIVDLVDEDSKQTLKNAMREAGIGTFCQTSLHLITNRNNDLFETKLININMQEEMMLLLLMRAVPSSHPEMA